MKTTRKNSLDQLSRYAILLLLIIALPLIPKAQNIGIGIDNPTEKLQVGGIIHSTEQGFRFPDGSLQTRAYNAYESQDAGDNRWIIIMDFTIPDIWGSFGFDTLDHVIKVIDYKWGMTYVPDPPGGGSGTFTIGKITITKNIDLASNSLLDKGFNGQIIQEFWLNFMLPIEGQGMHIYYKVKVLNSIITAFDQKEIFKGGDSYSHIETIEFEFESATWFYNDGLFSNQADYP